MCSSPFLAKTLTGSNFRASVGGNAQVCPPPALIHSPRITAFHPISGSVGVVANENQLANRLLHFWSSWNQVRHMTQRVGHDSWTQAVTDHTEASDNSDAALHKSRHDPTKTVGERLKCSLMTPILCKISQVQNSKAIRKDFTCGDFSTPDSAMFCPT